MRASFVLGLAALAVTPAVAQTVSPSVTSDATPESGDQVFQRARAAAVAGQHEDAIRLYSEILVHEPDHADARLGRGRTYAWLRRWPEAEVDLKAVTASSPGYADAWSALGDMYFWSDRPEQALAAYTQWQALQPADPRALLARSRAYRALGQREAARADLQAAAGLGAERSEVAAALATLESTDRPRVSNPEAAAPEGFTWSVQAELGHTRFSGSRAGWNDRALVLRRYLPVGSVAVELLETRRFDRDDQAWAIDAYLDTWARAYVNLRYQHAPDATLFPGHAWRAELFQGVGQGWELSAGIDQLRFRSSTADIYSLGVGRYVGSFYARVRSRYAPGSDSLGHTAQLRYYYAGNGDEYVELSAGTGSRDEERFGIVTEESSRSVGLAYVRYFTPNLGLRLTAGHVDAAMHESKAAATVYYRW